MNSLDQIINNVENVSARAKLVSELVGKPGIAEGLVQEAIDFYSESDPLKAAQIAEKSGLEDESVRLYKKVMEKYESEKKFVKAATIARKIGLVDREVMNYAKHGRFKSAAERALDAGLFEIALCIYEMALENEKLDFKDRKRGNGVGKYVEFDFSRLFFLADCEDKKAKFFGLVEKSIAYFEKSYVHRDMSIRLANDFGTVELEISIYESRKSFKEAGETSELAGQKDRAIKFYEKAIERYESFKMFSDAAELADHIGLDEKARALYKKAFENLPKHQRSPQLAKLAGIDPKGACDEYIFNKKIRLALSFEEKQDFAKAASAYYDAYLFRQDSSVLYKALENYEKASVSQTHQNFFLEYAKAAREAGLDELARENIKRALHSSESTDSK